MTTFNYICELEMWEVKKKENKGPFCNFTECRHNKIITSVNGVRPDAFMLQNSQLPLSFTQLRTNSRRISLLLRLSRFTLSVITYDFKESRLSVGNSTSF